MRSLLVLSALLLGLLLAVPAAAQDAGGDAGRAATRTAHDAYETVLRDPPPAPREGPNATYHEAVRAWQSRLAEAERRFVDAFRATRWEEWSAETDTELLQRGLLFVGKQAFAAGDGDTTIRALELLIAKLPALRRRLAFPVHELPRAYVLAGRVEEGRRRTEELLAIGPEMYRPRLLVTLGDYECLLGDLDAARAFYRRADAAVSDELRNCCGAEAAAARDAVIKLRALGAVTSVPDAAWRVGDELPAETRVTVVAFADIYRSWDATLVVRLGNELAERAVTGAAAVVATPATPRATPDAEGMPARDPRYAGRATPDYAGPERAGELRRNLGLTLPVVGVADTAIPCDLWTGDYDVVVVPGSGAVYVRGPAQDRIFLHAVVARAATTMGER